MDARDRAGDAAERPIPGLATAWAIHDVSIIYYEADSTRASDLREGASGRSRALPCSDPDACSGSSSMGRPPQLMALAWRPCSGDPITLRTSVTVPRSTYTLGLTFAIGPFS